MGDFVHVWNLGELSAPSAGLCCLEVLLRPQCPPLTTNARIHHEGLQTNALSNADEAAIRLAVSAPPASLLHHLPCSGASNFAITHNAFYSSKPSNAAANNHRQVLLVLDTDSSDGGSELELGERGRLGRDGG